MEDFDWEKRGKEIVEEYKQNISKALNYLDASQEIFERIASDLKWNDDITWLVTEAQAKLGTALASLTTWYDE